MQSLYACRTGTTATGRLVCYLMLDNVSVWRFAIIGVFPTILVPGTVLYVRSSVARLLGVAVLMDRNRKSATLSQRFPDQCDSDMHCAKRETRKKHTVFDIRP
jgi:hypothetical protein